MRIAVFASYDKAGKVHEYVLRYLTYLKEVAEKVIFIADNGMAESEKEKLKGLADYIQCQKHGEYDFGSYKRGYHYAEQEGWLEKADEIVFCNDSCFCIRPLKPVFEQMDLQECDFWGLTASVEIQPHLQSFFWVFKKRVFLSATFKTFIQSIKKQADVGKIVLTYEVPLKGILNEVGFKDQAYLTPKNRYNPMSYAVDCLERGCPLLKKRAFYGKENCRDAVRKIIKEVKKISGESYQDICSYFKHISYVFFPLITSRDVVGTCRFLHRFFYTKKTTSSGYLLVKICKIPVYKKKQGEKA